MSIDAPQYDWRAIFGPTPAQLRFLTSRHRFRFFLAGIGAGKTWTVCLDAILRALVNPGSLGAICPRTFVEGRDIHLPQLKAHFERWQEATGFSLLAHVAAGEQRLTLINGSSIVLRAYEREEASAIRGRNWSWAIADEVCWSRGDQEKTLTALVGRVRVPCPVPGLAFASSPNGLRGVTKVWRERILAGDPDYAAFRCTSLDNPHLERATIEGWRRTMSRARFEQEVMAIVQRPSNVVFPMFSEELHIRAPRQSTPWARWILACDWGRNHAVALLIRVEESGEWTVMDEAVDAPGSYEAFRPQIERLCARWPLNEGRPDYAVGDRAVRSENAWLDQRFGRRGTEVWTIRDRKAQRIRDGLELISVMLEPADEREARRLFFSRDLARTTTGSTAPVVAAMLGYGWSTLEDGTQTDDPHKDDIHDHAIDALRYAVVASRYYPHLHGGRSLDAPDRD